MLRRPNDIYQDLEQRGTMDSTKCFKMRDNGHGAPVQRQPRPVCASHRQQTQFHKRQMMLQMSRSGFTPFPPSLTTPEHDDKEKVKLRGLQVGIFTRKLT